MTTASARRGFSRRTTAKPALAAAQPQHRPANPVADLRASLAIPRARFARLVGRTERAVIDWETGRAQPQGLSRQRVRELERLTAALRELFDPRCLGAWFDTPNPALDGFKPVEIIERGETDRLWRMLFELQSGAHR